MTASKLAVLAGTHDPESPLSVLAGDRLAISTIFKKLDELYEEHITDTQNAYKITNYYLLALTFPPTQHLDINMMPFRLFDKDTLPAACHPYYDIILTCRRFTPYDPNAVAYLTVHESDVAAGDTQRRPGLHVESPVAPGHLVPFDSDIYHHRALYWGGGSIGIMPVGGIFMASNVANTSRVWPVLVERHEEIADAHGGIECLRPYLGRGYKLKANELCWFTDRTPHEALPVSDACHRQFFRLVVGKIDVWYAQHSTPNPRCPLPDDVKIVYANKFEA